MIKVFWEILTFQNLPTSEEPHYYLDMTIAILIWLITIICLTLITALFIELTRIIYRSIAYQYETETLPAQVIGKSYTPSTTHLTYNAALKVPLTTTNSPQYNVKIITSNGLSDVINDRSLYRQTREGTPLTVTMKIGRNRHQQIKYWKVTKYSY